MKDNNAVSVDKKYTILDIFANQHPIINCWIMLSAMAIVALYAITFTTL